MARVILLYTSPYEITNKETGKLENDGMTVFYYGRESMKPVVKTNSSGEIIRRGLIPCKANLPKNLESQVVDVPGVYEIETEIEAAGANDLRAITKVVDFEFVGKLETKIISVSQPSAK